MPRRKKSPMIASTRRGWRAASAMWGSSGRAAGSVTKVRLWPSPAPEPEPSPPPPAGPVRSTSPVTCASDSLIRPPHAGASTDRRSSFRPVPDPEAHQHQAVDAEEEPDEALGHRADAAEAEAA